MAVHPGRKESRGVVAALREAVAEAREDRITTTAQALAFSLFLAIPATFLLLLGIFSLAAAPGDVAGLVERLESVMPPEAAELLGNSLERTSNSAPSGITMTVVGLALALWTTTSAASGLMEGIATAFDARDERSFVARRAIAFVIVISLVAAAMLVLGLLVLGPHLERWIGEATGATTLTAWLWWTAQWPLLIGFLLLAFSIVLTLAPHSHERNWRLVSPGAVAALCIWLGASGALAVYSSRFGSYEKTWGTLSAVVVTMLWLWLGAVSLLFGAELDAAFRGPRRDDAATGARPAP
jgi:membrane protein